LLSWLAAVGQSAAAGTGDGAAGAGGWAAMGCGLVSSRPWRVGGPGWPAHCRLLLCLCCGR